MIRVATEDDLDAVAALEALCLGRDAWSAGLVREGIRGGLPTVTYLVAEEGGVVVGHAVLSLAGDVAELQRIAVAPAARRGGVASALLAAADDAARAAGAERVLLEVREDNGPALALYADRGFAEVDRRPRYYADSATAVVMQRPLAIPARRPDASPPAGRGTAVRRAARPDGPPE